MQLQAGQTVAIDDTALTVTVRRPLLAANNGPVDLIALVLGRPGEARDDADLVFYNQPSHPAGVATLLPPPNGETASLVIDLHRARPTDDRLVIAASDDVVPFDFATPVTVTVVGNRSNITAELQPSGGETALVLLQIYRHNGTWKVRALGQGYPTGLHGLVTDYQFEVEEQSPAPSPATPVTPPPRPAPPSSFHDGYTPQLAGVGPAANAASQLNPGQPAPAADRKSCPRCGQRYSRWSSVGGKAKTCKNCADQDRLALTSWIDQVSAVLRTGTPADLGPLWAAIRSRGVDLAEVRRALRPVALTHLKAQAGIAFTDGLIEDHELAEYDSWVRELRVDDDPEGALVRRRMVRAQLISRLEAGDLPVISAPGLHLPVTEVVHLDLPGATFVRRLASGTRHHPGRLVVLRSGIKFIGDSGHEYTWQKAVSAATAGGTLEIGTTLAKGMHSYLVPDVDVAAAVAGAALRISQRLVLAPRRDTRSIPQQVKAAVWQRDRGACAQCGRSEYLEFDHVIPYSRGGATSEGNLQLLCRSCNAAKGSRI